jgi:hypothetical protein
MKCLPLFALLIATSSCGKPHLASPQFIFPTAPRALTAPLPPLDTIQKPKAQ